MQNILDKIKEIKIEASKGKSTYSAPSNIALIKYWGKYKNQIPANPSISFSLDHSKSTTSFEYQPKKNDGEISIDFLFEGEKNDAFKERIVKYFESLKALLPMLTMHHFRISSSNSFPHSSGIASSASSMSALAMNIVDMLNQLSSQALVPADFLKLSSYLARLGSGSAARSVYGGFAVWGASEFFENSSDLFAIPADSQEIHPVFQNLNDDILIIEKGMKQVSSSAGHNLMNTHPFASARFDLARSRMGEMKEILRSGNLEEFGKLVENEALMLHSMMMTSNPSYILFKPNTIAAIESIWDYRNSENVPVFFTLDAGANVHLIYPVEYETKVRSFIDSNLVVYCENAAYLCDKLGHGPEKIN